MQTLRASQLLEIKTRFSSSSNKLRHSQPKLMAGNRSISLRIRHQKVQLPILRGEVSPEKEVSLVSYNFLEARDGVDILTMQTDRKPNDTESSLELILNTLCRAFSMKPKQAAALFTNNNQFLIHSIVKGVKGNYEPLNNWYNELKAHLKHMTYLLELETE